jgi:hypothetical protein
MFYFTNNKSNTYLVYISEENSSDYSDRTKNNNAKNLDIVIVQATWRERMEAGVAQDKIYYLHAYEPSYLLPPESRKASQVNN